ncbi:ankyrin repeat domain-containing protein 49-like isoform X2 [Microplitis mediator]|uniref:ankyrin repeat domain-containing protein 49-like isoform X2 n=1 Tax=Microplitis mediator TaxID=375433 RepID=UPI0025573886|nr:ankyrin repeat domain-containing protein 49-like isoform X2 [Microplitis mediator]
MSSDEENDEIQDPEKIRDKILKMHQGERMQASAWDDDNTGVESRRNPEDPDSLAILKAAANGNIGRVVKLVEENPTLVHVTDKDGYTPLHRACYRNYTSIVKELRLTLELLTDGSLCTQHATTSRVLKF